MLNSDVRSELHRLIDHIPKQKLPAISEWLQRIYEEEALELNEETKKEIEEGRQQIKKGEYVTLDELLKETDINV